MTESLIHLGSEICTDPAAGTGREWLETNGIGGFSSGTVTGIHTRRYHGLLTAATEPPVGRMLLLSRLEETLHQPGGSFELAANQYPGTLHPRGFEYIESFRLDPFPVWTYRAGPVRLEKAVFMVHGENTTVVEYRLLSEEACTLEVRPLVAFRDYHSLTHSNAALRPDVDIISGLATIRPYDRLPSLLFAHNAGELQRVGNWYYNFEYSVERERGLDFLEDLFCPFLLRFELRPQRSAVVIASLEARRGEDIASLRQSEVRRRSAVAASSPVNDSFVTSLVRAADAYIVRRGDSATIIAGYHWFTDWGRDTMISLPGLCLTTGRFATARQILREWARLADRGTLPNRFFDGENTPEYNTADATLWYFEAIRAYIAATGDAAFVLKELFPVLEDIMGWHTRGTRYGIYADTDGLLHAGEPGAQLTWMDAKIGDFVVTPRTGKPVEIQALWYNALCIFSDLARKSGNESLAATSEKLAARAKESFNALFWNAASGCLYDVVSDSGPDGTMRPNQILAVSLAHTMLGRERAQKVVRAVQEHLFTPLGLRSLAPGAPGYRSHYGGDVHSRDSAYHQGPVWPWLMGAFVTAWCRVHDNSPEARREAAEWLRPFEEHLTQAGLGHISEITDAEAPWTPAGCIAQAWSVAEILRVAVEVIHGITRKNPGENLHYETITT